MEYEKIKDIINSIDKSSLTDFELSLKDGFHIRMNKYKNGQVIKEHMYESENGKKSINIEKEQFTTKIAQKDEEKIEKEEENSNMVLSPLVGTFYSSSSPNNPPYVKVGDKVQAGDVLCIIEAMKVMNEVRSEYSGEVVKVLTKDEDMVAYNEPLFEIR